MRNKYGAREIIFLLVSSDDYTQYVIDRERTREAREKARLRRERQKAATITCDPYAAAIQHNRETGGSLWRTMLAAQADGDPDEMDRLLRIADAARARHEDTPYDDMLARGISRDTARMLAQSMEGKNEK